MKKLFLLFTIVFIANYAISQNMLKIRKLSSEFFLEEARRPVKEESWAKLIGTVQHLRLDEDPDKEIDINFAIQFTPVFTLGQIILNNKGGYTVGQSLDRESERNTTISPLGKDTRQLFERVGIHPQDLTMSFLYWNFKKELAMEKFSSLKCRVFILESLDKKEFVKVAISAEYFFPLKVQWFKTKSKKEYKSMEITSFDKDGDFAVVESLTLLGPGWRTEIEFDDTKIALSKDGVPKDLWMSFDK